MKLAQDLYRDVLQIQPSYLPALNNMAYLLTDNYGQSREALEMALKAYRQGGSDPSVMDTLGYVLVSNGKSRDALNVLRRAVELVPDNPTINLHLGMAYADLKEIDKARPYLEKTVMSGAPDERKLAEKLLQGN
jgi:Flp pilus assembly protein TadD